MGLFEKKIFGLPPFFFVNKPLPWHEKPFIYEIFGPLARAKNCKNKEIVVPSAEQFKIRAV
jgi:hypothetical protein